VSGKEKIKVGDLLVREGIITPDQLSRALSVQKRQKAYRPIGEICVDMKFLSSVRLNKVLNKHGKRIRLGDLLVKIGLVAPEKLKKALVNQKKNGGKLGDILTSMGAITETALINALTIQMGIPKIAPDFHLIDRSLLKGLNEEFLLKNEILPAFKGKEAITVIMANPLDQQTINELRQVFRCRIEPAIAPARDIHNAIKQHFRKATPAGMSVFEKQKKDLVVGDKKFSLGEGDNVTSILDYIITNAILEKASDIHIEPKEKSIRIRYRIDGILQHKTDLPISFALSLASRIKVLCKLDISEKRKHQDGRIEAKIMDQEVDLRVSVYASAYGENIVIRVLYRKTELMGLDSLGLSPVNLKNFERILDQPSGIMLVTGPTGSGKTTTLYSSLIYLNDGTRSIITVEDPVEYVMDGVVQGQLDPKLAQTYSDFLKSMMRQDPDVIMVGEIRDPTAAEAVIQAALTGHKVLSTFHTDDSTGALLRLMDMGIDTFLISSTVVSVVAQRLVRVLCSYCKEPYEPEAALIDSFGVTLSEKDDFTFYRPVGCGHCGDIGFRGRTAVHELLFVNDPIRNAILERKTAGAIRTIAREEADLISMREDGFYKAIKGITSLDEITRTVFCLEADEGFRRTAEEVVSLCEGKGYLFAGGQEISLAPDGADLERSTKQEEEKKERVAEGEAYRICFDTTTIAADIDQITGFFKAYQRISQEIGDPIDSRLIGQFFDFVVYTVKRVELSMRADFVEFSLWVQDGRIEMVLETLAPKEPVIVPSHSSKENGMRLLNYLLPASGLGNTMSTENHRFKEDPSQPEKVSLFSMLQNSEENRNGFEEETTETGMIPSVGGGSVQYVKHREALDWTGLSKSSQGT